MGLGRTHKADGDGAAAFLGPAAAGSVFFDAGGRFFWSSCAEADFFVVGGVPSLFWSKDFPRIVKGQAPSCTVGFLAGGGVSFFSGSFSADAAVVFVQELVLSFRVASDLEKSRTEKRFWFGPRTSSLIIIVILLVLLGCRCLFVFGCCRRGSFGTVPFALLRSDG